MRLGIKANWSRESPIVGALVRNGWDLCNELHSMEENAIGGLGINGINLPRHPVDQTLCVGGSSTGSAAALVNNTCDLALCSDTTGSGRVPAAFCGLVGYKPTKGVYSTQGLAPLSPTLDSPAFMSRDIETLSPLFAPASTTTTALKTVNSLPDLDQVDSFIHTIFLYEMRSNVTNPTTALNQRYLARSETITREQYQKALTEAQNWRDKINNYLGSNTVLVTPITALAQTPTLAQAHNNYDATVRAAMYWTRIANVLQGPSIALGSKNIMLTGTPNTDALLFTQARDQVPGIVNKS